MAAGNETNAFVRDGSMLPHHDIDTTTTPNSWKPKYPIHFGDRLSGGTIYNSDGDCSLHGVAVIGNSSGINTRDVILPFALTNGNYNVITQGDYIQSNAIQTDSANLAKVDENRVTSTTATQFTVSKATDFTYSGITTNLIWQITGVKAA